VGPKLSSLSSLPSLRRDDDEPGDERARREARGKVRMKRSRADVSGASNGRELGCGGDLRTAVALWIGFLLNDYEIGVDIVISEVFIVRLVLVLFRRGGNTGTVCRRPPLVPLYPSNQLQLVFPLCIQVPKSATHPVPRRIDSDTPGSFNCDWYSLLPVVLPEPVGCLGVDVPIRIGDRDDVYVLQKEKVNHNLTRNIMKEDIHGCQACVVASQSYSRA
jgi:hypothetical protein